MTPLRTRLTGLAAITLLAAPALAAERPFSLGARGSWADGVDFSVGAVGTLSLDKYAKDTELIGSFDYVFEQDVRAYNYGNESPAESHYDRDGLVFGLSAVRKFTLRNTSARPYAGAGVFVTRQRLQLNFGLESIGGHTNTNARARILAGLILRKHVVTEVSYELGFGGTLYFSAGLRF